MLEFQQHFQQIRQQPKRRRCNYEGHLHLQFRVFLCVVIFALGVGAGAGASADESAAGIFDENCWSNSTDCRIAATIRSSVAAEQIINLNCDIGSYEEPFEQINQWNQIDGAKNVTFNGCNSSLGSNSVGFELLPDCNAISEATFIKFHVDALQSVHCANSLAVDVQLKVLVLKHNEIGTIDGTAFTNLTNLQEVYLVDNSLHHIDPAAFSRQSLQFLHLIHIQEEPFLIVRDAHLFENTSASSIYIFCIKRLNVEVLTHLTTALENLYISDTALNDVEENVAEVLNPLQLRNISLVNCALKTLVLRDAHCSVTALDISKNNIEKFSTNCVCDSESESTSCALEILDLSENSLKSIDMDWFVALSNLKLLSLRGNMLKSISLDQFVSVLPSVRSIDLRANQMVGFKDITQHLNCDYLRIRIDHNPWNCVWMSTFAHEHPEKFRIFQYNKYISKINVNGLECSAEQLPDDIFPNDVKSFENVSADGKIKTDGNLNISTYTLIYGNPWDLKRNQRAEALIIVFLLPVGIAFLFLLLYMWIHCQKIFHLSYYRSNPLIGSCTAGRAAERFDIVRQLPPSTGTYGTAANNNEDYEIPLNSFCNCNNATRENHKCFLVNHATYENPPIDQPFKLYEEINEEEGNMETINSDVPPNEQPLEGTAVHPLYDHLSFSM
ncbi:uncharacterized protein LOC119687835 [Teleopsis dalmanni]|uniref:uncharacterized protein LOC119687835 n=1 Tax=Teleopsis dalmanni TaxID=139649 RepID=UPI0018CEC470|nr:uncharacterized protein LOC119687835 [Teleopsis dalmanni]